MDLAKGAWAEYAPEEWADIIDLLPMAEQIRAYLPEDGQARWALAATVPVTAAAAAAALGVLIYIYNVHHRPEAMEDACGPLPPALEPLPSAPATVEMDYEGGQHGGSGDGLLDWTTRISQWLQYWVGRMVASAMKHVPALEEERAGQRLAQHLQRLLAGTALPLVVLAAVALVFLAAPLLTIVYLGLDARQDAAKEKNKRSKEHEDMTQAAAATATWRESMARAAVETETRALFARMRERDRQRQIQRQEVLLRVLQAHEARARAADAQAALAVYDRCWALLTGIHALERTGLPDTSREQLEGIMGSQWHEFDRSFASASYWARHGVLPAADAQWLQNSDSKPVLLFQRLARMPCPGFHDPWRCPTRADVLASAVALPAMDPSSLNTYTKPAYAGYHESRPSSRALWPEAMALAKLHPLLQRRYLQASDPQTKEGLRAVWVVLVGDAKVSSKPIPHTTAAFATLRLAPVDGGVSSGAGQPTPEVVLFVARALSGGGLAPVAAGGSPTIVAAFLLPDEAQSLAWAMGGIRHAYFRHAHPPLVWSGDSSDDEHEGLAADTGASAAEPTAATSAGISDRPRPNLEAVLSCIEAFLDTEGLRATLQVVGGARREHRADPSTISYPYYCEVVWGVRASQPPSRTQGTTNLSPVQRQPPQQLEVDKAVTLAVTLDDNYSNSRGNSSSIDNSSRALSRSATIPMAAPRMTAIPIARAMSSSSLQVQVFTMTTATAMPMDLLGQVIRDKAAKASSGSLHSSPSRWSAARQHTERISISSGEGQEEPTWTETTFTRPPPLPPAATSHATRVMHFKPSTPRSWRRRRLAVPGWIFATLLLLLILAETLRYHVHLGMANREATKAAMLARRRLPEPGGTIALLNVLADVREGDPDWPARCEGDTSPNSCHIQRRADHEEWMRLRQLDPDRGRRLFNFDDEDDGSLAPYAKGEGWWWEYL